MRSEVTNVEQIIQLIKDQDWEHARVCASLYRMECAEAIQDPETTVEDAAWFLSEHTSTCRLLDLLIDKIAEKNRQLRLERQQRELERSERIAKKAGNWTGWNSTDFHVDPEILAAAERNELVFDRDF